MEQTKIKLLEDNPTKTQPIKSKAKGKSIYTQMMINRKVYLPISNIGGNIKQKLENKIAYDIEGKCTVEGFVKPDTTRVISYSCGVLQGTDVVFNVVVSCYICTVVEGMNINCVAKTITDTAGIKAEIEESPSPLIIYIARDHNYDNPTFSKVKIGDKLKVKVIGQRFELNDSYISVIAELVEIRNSRKIKLKIKK